MKSLRAHLTIWLWVTLALVGVVCAGIAILQARHEAAGQVDYQLLQVARIIASQPITASSSAQFPDAEVLPATRVRHDRDDDLMVTVRDASGQLLYASRPGGTHPIAPPVEIRPGFHTVQGDGEAFRVFVGTAHGLTIQVAQSVGAIREAEGAMAFATLLPFGILLPVLALVVAFGIRRGLGPLRRAAAAISSRPPLSLDLVQTHDMPAEVQPLVGEINRLIGRVGSAVERERRFVTDAAHALRTPLTALQLQADVLEDARNEVDRRERLQELRAGVRRIIRLSEQMLSLARTQSEVEPISTTIDLDPTLEEVVASYMASARARDIELSVDVASKSRVCGSAGRLALIAGNLLDNALRFTPARARVEVRAFVRGDHACIEVRDQGPGLQPEELPRVFERFYQGSANEGGGSGLGLATVDALVKQLGGSVSLANRSDGPGLIALVTLLIAPVAQGGPL